MDEPLKKVAEAVARRERIRLAWMTPLSLVFVALGVVMAQGGYPFGWAAAAFGAAGFVVLPAMAMKTLRKSRYAGGRFEARRVPLETLAMVLGALLMATAGLYGGWLWRDTVKGLVLMGCGGVFVLIAVAQAVGLFARGPAVIIDANGFFDRRTMRRKIAWAEVEGIEQVEIKGTRFFRLRTADEAACANAMGRLGHVLGQPGFGLTVSGLDCSLTDLLSAVEQNSGWRTHGNTAA